MSLPDVTKKKWKTCQKACGVFFLFIVAFSYIQSSEISSYFQHIYHHWYKSKGHSQYPQAPAVLAHFHERIQATVNSIESVIRLTAIVKLSADLEYRCHIDCNGTMFSNEAQVEAHSSDYSFTYQLVDLLCQNPCALADTLVSVDASALGKEVWSVPAIHICALNDAEPPQDFTACISAFSEYKEAQVIRDIEMYQFLGAEKILIYGGDSFAEMHKQLETLINKGCVEVVDWSAGSFLYESNRQDFKRDLQVAAWIDCFYRNLHRSRKLALSDSQEISLYSKNSAWTKMLHFLIKKNFTLNDFNFQDREKCTVFSSEMECPGGEQEEKCGCHSSKQLQGMNSTFAYITLSTEPGAEEQLSPLAQCFAMKPPQETVTFVGMTIKEKEILPTLVTPVKDAQAFVLSAFYDDRQNQNRIRIIGIAKRDHYGNQGGKLYCHVQCEDGVHVEPISAEVHNDHFSFPYGATTFVCTNPCSSAALSNVTVSTSSDGTSPGVTLIIQNTKDSRPPEPQQEFTVCTSTMFNKFSNVLQLLQSLEMYRLLGAGKVVIYKTSCSDQVQEVLDYYVKEGFVQMFDWTANLYLTVSKSWSFALDKADLHYQGQIVALNDCLYRHMYSSRHLVFIDQDEIIVPYKHDNWRDLIDYLGKMTPGANIFRFSNRVFPTDTYGKDPNAIQWNDVPGVNIMQYVNRETELESYDPKKMILDPRIVYKTSVHLPLDHFGSEKDVDEQDALMFHFKEHKVISEPWKDLRLSHYEAQLRLNVNKVLSQTLRRSYPLVVTPVDGADVFIISAFCDDRKLYQLSHDVIHIIGIVKRDQFENQHTALHCHIECESVVLHRHVHVQLHDDHHDFPYGTADFLCQNPCGSAAFIRVAVSTSDVSSSSDVYLNVHNSKVTQSTQPQRNFTVCISAMAENNDNVLQLVQSIEMYRRLGAEKVFIYKTNCSAEVQKVLDYYTAEGFLVVFNWTVDSYLKSSEILNHGQDTALHDCLYRNMYASRYLVINDIGEIILPYRHDNWQDLLDSLQSQNSRHRIFMFSSRIFHRNDSPEISGVSEWQNIPGVNIFQYVYREKEVQKSESKKIILDPQSVPGVFIPHFLERTEEVKEVDEDDAVLFLCEDRTANSMVINDSRIAYFDYKLKEKVNTVLNGVI